MKEKKASLVMSEENKGHVSRRDALIKCLEELFSNTADGVIAIDPEGKIIFWNRSADQKTGGSVTLPMGFHDHPFP